MGTLGRRSSRKTENPSVTLASERISLTAWRSRRSGGKPSRPLRDYIAEPEQRERGGLKTPGRLGPRSSTGRTVIALVGAITGSCIRLMIVRASSRSSASRIGARCTGRSAGLSGSRAIHGARRTAVPAIMRRSELLDLSYLAGSPIIAKALFQTLRPWRCWRARVAMKRAGRRTGESTRSRRPRRPPASRVRSRYRPRWEFPCAVAPASSATRSHPDTGPP